MTRLLAIAAGGAVGALLRYWVSTGMHVLLGRDFPYGTLTVNVTGCLAMGFLSVLFLERMEVGPEWRAAILIGLLGAFTTFSTFSIETFNLIEGAQYFKAGLNMTLSLAACMVATWVGVLGGRTL
ncbi:MAG: camphor resistance protein CrcB [Chromatiales bacterium 21-64-14]|nr:MAG: camphor resistance protein CrcB [Chromatiales bacterium 21-64-14]HQU15665.1 fluoride efflux transporter CrcB [Gammaproteobacteria bacterium]